MACARTRCRNASVASDSDPEDQSRNPSWTLSRIELACAVLTAILNSAISALLLLLLWWLLSWLLLLLRFTLDAGERPEQSESTERRPLTTTSPKTERNTQPALSARGRHAVQLLKPCCPNPAEQVPHSGPS